MVLRSLALVSLVTLYSCTPEPSFTVRETVEQLYVTHAEPGQTLVVLDASGHEVATGTADDQGSLIFRGLKPGEGYVIRVPGRTLQQTKPLKVPAFDAAPPASTFYGEQKLVAGFNYLRMRDGTTLSAFVTLPSGKGPFPTVVSYAGYDMARPGQPISGFDFLCADFPVACDAPSDPSSLFAALFGYATVSVNVRGTGCSGGAYDFFEKNQLVDGYDVIEIVAAQDWVRFHKVGMVGLSYPGIAQLFVASMKPPSLAAIAPMSVIDNTTRTMRPGGILNEGFAVSWIDAVVSKAAPYGQGWERARVDGGDEVCRENQLLHGQLVDNVKQAHTTLFYDPALHDRLNPDTFVDRIEVPVFLFGAWQDEQTGPYFFTLFDRFINAPALRLTVTNGVHADGFTPQVLIEWQQFLELFVAHRIPIDPSTVRSVSTFVFDDVYHSPLELPPSRFSGYGSYEQAVTAWKAEPPLRVIFESGAGRAGDPGAPVGTFERAFSKFPPEELTPRRLYFQPGARLSDAPPTVGSASSSFRFDPEAGARINVTDPDAVMSKQAPFVWPQPSAGTQVVFESDALLSDTVLLGTASFDIWLQSPVDDADLQVTLSEVTADGHEVYLQSGWLRASQRAPGPNASVTWPDQRSLEADNAPLVPNAWMPVRVATAGFAHALRAGSKVRAAIDTPGGTRSRWTFELKPFAAGTRYSIGHDAEHPSSVVLPVVAGVTVPTPAPACLSLRGQPCRPWQPYTNTAE